MSLILLFHGPLLGQAPAPPVVNTGFAHADVSIAPPNATAVSLGAAMIETEGRARTSVADGHTTSIGGRGRRTTIQ